MKLYHERGTILCEGVWPKTTSMFAENDSAAIKSSAIDSAWTEVIQNIQIYIESRPSHEVTAL